LFDGDNDFHAEMLQIILTGVIGQATRRQLRDVQQLRYVFAPGCEGIAKHAVAEGAGCPYGGGARGGQFRGAHMAHTLAGLFAEEGQATAGSATKTAFMRARSFK
jgi:hypothetical protein